MISQARCACTLIHVRAAIQLETLTAVKLSGVLIESQHPKCHLDEAPRGKGC